MVGRTSRNRSKPSPANAGAQPAPARRPVEIINCFDDDDDVIIEENGDKEGEQLVMECEEEELTPEQQRAYEMAEQNYDYAPPMAQYPNPSLPSSSSNNGSSPPARPTRTSGRVSAAPTPSPSRAPPTAPQRRQAAQRTPQAPPRIAPKTPQQPRPTPPTETRGTRSSSRKVEETITLFVDAKTGGVIGSIPDSVVPSLILPPGTALRKAAKSSIPNAVPLQMTSTGRARGIQRQIVMPTTSPVRPAPARGPARAAQQPTPRGGRAAAPPPPPPPARGRAAAAPPPPPKGRTAPPAPTRGRGAQAAPGVQPSPARGVPPPSATSAGTVRTVELKPTPSGSKPSRGPLSPFPTLFTFPKPFHALPPNVIQSKRVELDAKVKALLVYTPSKFTEWLIQAGLLRSKQNCTVHKSPKGEQLPLKLAMYNDSTKFPSTGGYVWISDCCPERFVSVFRGSIFEGQNHPPVTVLKLVYHWACQTNPSNVMSWVKTEAHYINGFYRLIKSLCALAVYSQMPKFGGAGKTVEVASVHLFSPATPTGRSTSIEVFGLFDRSTRMVRLLAVDRGHTSVPSRYITYRQYMTAVVHPRSTVVVDPSLEVGSLAQALPSARFVGDGRQAENVVNYLTKHVPKIFANTLGTLNIAQVQPFLDELAWREKWGRSAADAYDNMLTLLAAETKSSDDIGEALIARLSKIASAPAVKTLHQMVPVGADENLPAAPMRRGGGQAAASAATPAQRQALKRPAAVGPSPRGATPMATYSPSDEHASAAKRMRPPEMVKLGEYYYAQMAANKTVQNPPPSSFKCPVCQKVFNGNVMFTRHLFVHLETARSFSIDLGDLTLCKYCFRNFGTPYALQAHLEEVHLRKHNSLVCGICNEPFKNRMDLIGHMHVNHVQAELPYGCEMCGFRSSFHRCLLDHFETAHSESDRMLCHFCLKTYNNRGVFFQHIQKHQGKKDQPAGSRNKCKKCCLSFQKPEHLRDHLQKDHISFHDFAGLEPAPGLEPGVEEIMMPKPDEKKRRKGPPVFFPSVYSNGNLNVTMMKKPGEGLGHLSKMICVECGKPMDKGHVKTAWQCSHCRYSTCCDAMANCHVAKFHGTTPSFDMSKPVCLKKTMFCVCGFGSYSGNQLATHLALCGKKSAYPSRHRASLATVSAQSATFPELITLDEDEDDNVGGDGVGDAFDGGDFGGDDVYDDYGEGASSGVKNEQGGRAGGPDGKKRRRRRHGAEDINTIWLKAIWASQNLIIPNGDVEHAEDYEYMDEETPEELQAVGLHKHGACKKVKKAVPVPQQPVTAETPSKAASPEPCDVGEVENDNSDKAEVEEITQSEEKETEPGKKEEDTSVEPQEAMEVDAEKTEEGGVEPKNGEETRVEVAEKVGKHEQEEAQEVKKAQKGNDDEAQQDEKDNAGNEEEEQKKEDEVEEVKEEEASSAKIQPEGQAVEKMECDQVEKLKENGHGEKAEVQELKDKQEESEDKNVAQDHKEEDLSQVEEAAEAEEGNTKHLEMKKDKQGEPEVILEANAETQGQEQVQSEASLVSDEVQMDVEKPKQLDPPEVQPLPEPQEMLDVAEELIKSLVPGGFSVEQQQAQNGSQIPDFSQMNQDSMDLDVTAGFSLDQFT